MRSPRMTIRRWMLAVAFMAVQLWGGIALYRWCMPPEPFDSIDAVEMLGAASNDC
jgi:hypothetical protein